MLALLIDESSRSLVSHTHPHTPSEHSQPTFCQAPWGGFKQSGFGRELGPWGLEGYRDVKQVTTYRKADTPFGYFKLK